MEGYYNPYEGLYEGGGGGGTRFPIEDSHRGYYNPFKDYNTGYYTPYEGPMSTVLTRGLGEPSGEGVAQNIGP